MRTNDRAAWAHAAARALSRSGRRMLSLTLSLVLALTLLPGMALAAGEGVAINDTNFPDKNFRTYISKVYDENNNDILDANEIAAVKTIDVSRKEIKDLTGIEHFENLTKLLCYNNQLTTLDVSENKALTLLTCDNNELTSLDVSGNTALMTLSCGFNKLESLNVSGSAALTYLSCDNNKLTSLNVSGNPNLTNLYCGSNQLTSLNVSGNHNLTNLYCGSNQLTSLDLSNTKVTDRGKLDTNGNQYPLNLEDNKYKFDLSELKQYGFEVDKVLNNNLNLSGGTITDDNTLMVNPGAEMVIYQYNSGKRDSDGNVIYARFMLRVHSAPVRAIELAGIGTDPGFDDLNVRYSTVAEKNFIIRNTGNMSTSELKVVLEGEDANAFQFEIKDVTLTKDGNIPSIEVGGAVPTVIYKPKGGLEVGTYTAKMTVKSADDNGKAISESFNISLTVKDPTSAGFTLSKTTYAFPALQYGYTAVSSFAVTVTNTGSQATGDLKVTCDSSYFEVAPADISSISENGTATFQVRPKLGLPVGSHSGTVTVTNGTESQSFHVSLEVTAAEKVKTPVITPSGGSFTEPQTVTITCGTEDASIFYTTDGSDVDVKNTPYTGSFTVSETTTIKAKATKANMENSDTVTVIITISSGGGTGGGGTTPTQPAAPKLPFTDVSEDDWFYADAAYLYEKGVMKGTADETFAPGRSVTRGQLAAALYRMAGEPAVTAKAAFTDVPADYWCAAAITWAAENGVVTGYGGGFRPADAVQRQELAAMLFRFAVYQGMSAVTLEENLAPFADRADVAAYAVPAMNWAVGQGILQGKDGSLLPQAPVDRAQLAAMLRRYLEK